MAESHRRLRLALVAIDAREAHGAYDRAEPFFGTAVESLLEGFIASDELETHVVTVTRRAMKSPDKLGPHTFFHSLVVSKWAMMRTMYFGAVRAIRRKLREIAPDVVHGQGTERESALAAAGCGFPNAITIHGNIREIARKRGTRPFDFYWLASRLEARAIRRTDGVVCVSSYTRRLVGDLAARTWLIPNAAEQRFFQPRADIAKPPLLLCVGRVDAMKNQLALVRALDAAAARQPFRLLILGDLNPQGECGATLLRELESRPWATWKEHVARGDLAALFASATALVHPSTEDNCPMVVLEAMAGGVPVIASAIGGIPDLVQDGTTGILCDPTRMESFADAVVRIIEDPGLAARMSDAARARAETSFRPSVVAARHVEVYRELVSTRS